MPQNVTATNRTKCNEKITKLTTYFDRTNRHTLMGSSGTASNFVFPNRGRNRFFGFAAEFLDCHLHIL